MANSTCTRCNGKMVEINIRVGEAHVTMQSCSECDRREWHQSGQSVNLGGVLDGLADNPPPRRAVAAS